MKSVACVVLLVALFSMSPAPAIADGIVDQLRRGHWVEVRGKLEHGIFHAERLDLRDPDRHVELRGIAGTDIDGGGLYMLGRPVLIDPDTRGASHPGRLLGQPLRVRGEFTRSGAFRATRIGRRTSTAQRIRGRIDAVVHRPDGSTELQIAAFRVLLHPGIETRARILPELARRSLPVPFASGDSDMGDIEDLLGEGRQIGSDFHLALRQDMSLLDRNNFELDATDDDDVDAEDDRRDTILSTRARLTWSGTSRYLAVVDGQYRRRLRRLRAGATDHSNDYRLRAAYFMARDVIGGDLAIGRQDFDDPREWLYDADLDALRYFTQTRHLNWELSWSRVLEGGSARDEASSNSILYVSNRHGEDHRALYAINRRFEDSLLANGEQRWGDNLTHTGLRALETFNDHLDGWLDISGLFGERNRRDVRAWAVDGGLRWSLGEHRPWVVTLGYARASGDRGKRVDSGFRQTGLQDNEARLGGVSPVRFYGEAFDPELANLRVASLALAKHLARRSSIELIGHTYHQVVPATRLPNTGIDRRPNGSSSDLGWAIDAVLAIRESRRWELNVVGGYFHPGKAFDDADPAWLAELQARFRF